MRNDGDTLIVGNGIYNEIWTITNSNLNIIGNSSKNVIIDLSNQLSSINILGTNNTISNINFTCLNENVNEMIKISNNNNTLFECEFFCDSNNITMANISNNFNTHIEKCNVFMKANFSNSFYIYGSLNCYINNSSFLADGKDSSSINISNSEIIEITNCNFKTVFSYEFPKYHGEKRFSWLLCSIVFHKCKSLLLTQNYFNLSGGSNDPNLRVYSVGIMTYPFYYRVMWKYSIHSYDIEIENLIFIHNLLSDTSIQLFGVSDLKIINISGNYSSNGIIIVSSENINIINNPSISTFRMYGVKDVNIKNNTILRMNIWSRYENGKLIFSNNISIINNIFLTYFTTSSRFSIYRGTKCKDS